MNQLFYTMIVIARSLRRKRTDILYVGESAQSVGEITRRQNDLLPVFFSSHLVQMKRLGFFHCYTRVSL